MSTTLEEIKEAAASLPEAQRAELIGFLLTTLNGDEAVLEEWLDVAEKRMGKMESGSASEIPAEEFLDSLLVSKLRAKARQNPPPATWFDEELPFPKIEQK